MAENQQTIRLIYPFAIYYNGGKMEEPNWSYIAGIVDGEGCISIFHHKVRNRKKGNQYDSIFPRIYVTNTSKKLIDYLVLSTGFGRVRKYDFKNNYKTRYDWEISSPKQITFFLLKIKDFLKIKKEQCDLMLDFLKNRVIMTDFRDNMGRIKKIDIDDNPNYFYCKKMRILNKRGK